VELVGTRTAVEPVVAAVPVQLVDAIVAVELVVVEATPERVGSRSTTQQDREVHQHAGTGVIVQVAKVRANPDQRVRGTARKARLDSLGARVCRRYRHAGAEAVLHLRTPAQNAVQAE
jgi:hypothetical protein